MSDAMSDDESFNFEEDSDSSIVGFIKESTVSYTLSLSTAAILFTISFLSINWMSAVYLFGGCFYLARLIDERKYILFFIYSILGLASKLTVFTLSYTTNYFDTDSTSSDIRNFKRDLFNSIGFSFISMEKKAIILSFAEDSIAIIGLTIIIYLSHRLKGRREVVRNPSGESLIRDPEVMLEPEVITTRTIIISHFWFWLMTIFLILVYIFGSSALHMIMFCNLWFDFSNVDIGACRMAEESFYNFKVYS